MDRFLRAFFRKSQADGRSFVERIHDGLTALIVGKRTVIMNASLTVAAPIMLGRRAMVMDTRCDMRGNTSTNCSAEFHLGRG
jgi:hypothetical protein